MVDVTIEVGLGLFWPTFIDPWALTPRSNFCSIFWKNSTKLRIFRALDWLSSVCGFRNYGLKTTNCILHPLGPRGSVYYLLNNLLLFCHNLLTPHAIGPMKGFKRCGFSPSFFLKKTKNCLLKLGFMTRWCKSKKRKPTLNVASTTKILNPNLSNLFI